MPCRGSISIALLAAYQSAPKIIEAAPHSGRPRFQRDPKMFQPKMHGHPARLSRNRKHGFIHLSITWAKTRLERLITFLVNIDFYYLSINFDVLQDYGTSIDYSSVLTRCFRARHSGFTAAFTPYSATKRRPPQRGTGVPLATYVAILSEGIFNDRIHEVGTGNRSQVANHTRGTRGDPGVRRRSFGGLGAGLPAPSSSRLPSPLPPPRQQCLRARVLAGRQCVDRPGFIRRTQLLRHGVVLRQRIRQPYRVRRPHGLQRHDLRPPFAAIRHQAARQPWRPQRG